MLQASAISPEVANARGYRSLERKVDVGELGFTRGQSNVPGLLIPVWGTVGAEPVTYQYRPDQPRSQNGKLVKYETPPHTSMRLDVPPGVRPLLGDPSVPLLITEGAKKADSAASVGLCCVALLGVWNWRGTNIHGGKTVLPDFEYLALNGRRAYIVFDSDVTNKPAVQKAMIRLREVIKARGAEVLIVHLEPGSAGRKVGLDDFLASGHSPAALFALATDNVGPGPTGCDAHDLPEYEATGESIIWHKPTHDGTVPVLLSNFTARIVEEVTRDDGLARTPHYIVEASHAGRTTRLEVQADRFDGLGWVPQALGPTAAPCPGPAIRDRLRFALRTLSVNVRQRAVYSHTGWRLLPDGRWVYLHATGAIGAPGGQVPDVGFCTQLGLFRLPDLPGNAAVRDALRASLDLVNIGDAAVTFPVVAAAYRAPLGPIDGAVFLTGPSGTFKSELAALAQQHYGPGMDRLHLPASWSATDNFLEEVAFLAKDALLVIDDFAPAGGPNDVRRYHCRADRVLRAQGNGSGRGRMWADGTLRQARPPRGMILSTGEDIPSGHSLRARNLIVEVRPGSIRLDALTVAQRAARGGLYAQAMAAYIAWLADRRHDLDSLVARNRDELRSCLAPGAHARTPNLIADLLAGVRLFIDFAVEVGAMGAPEAQTYMDRALGAFEVAADAQRAMLTAHEPARRFREVIVAAVASGRAHFSTMDGRMPANPGAWGWEPADDATGWRARGDRVGYIDDDVAPQRVYFIPPAAYSVARRMAGDGPDGIVVTEAALWRALRDAGFIVTEDGARRTNTVRRTVCGQRVALLHLREPFLSVTDRDQCDQCDHPRAPASPETGTNGAPTGQAGSGVPQWVEVPL